MGTPSQSYGTSLAIWDHTVLPRVVVKVLRLEDEDKDLKSQDQDKDKELSFKDKDKDKDLGRH